MLITIEIPEEFICDYEADRFEDCFQRFICDSKAGLMAGNYERETAEMLIKAFRDAKEAKQGVVKQGRWIKSDDGDDGWCSRCKCDMPMFMDENWEWKYTETAYCPNCGAKMDGEEHETD